MPATPELGNQEADSALTHPETNGCSNLQTGSLLHGAVCTVTSMTCTAKQASGKSDSRAVGTEAQKPAELLAHPSKESPSPEYHDCMIGPQLQEAEEAALDSHWVTEQAPEGSIEQEGQVPDSGYQETEPGPALDSGYQETEPGPALDVNHPGTEDLQGTCASGNALQAPSNGASPALQREQVHSQATYSIVPDTEEPCERPAGSADTAITEDNRAATYCLENSSSLPGASQPGKLAEAGSTEVPPASQMQVLPGTVPTMPPSTHFDDVPDTDPTLSGSLPLPLLCSNKASLPQGEQLPAGMSDSLGEAVGSQAAELASLLASMHSQPDSVASLLGREASAVLATGPGVPHTVKRDRQQAADPLAAAASVPDQPASGGQAAHLESEATHCTSEEPCAMPGTVRATAVRAALFRSPSLMAWWKFCDNAEVL